MTTDSYSVKHRRKGRMTLLIAAAATAAIVLLLKPTSASGVYPAAAAHSEPPTRSAKLQRIVRHLVAAGAPGAIAIVRTPTSIRQAAAGVAELHPPVRMQPADRFRMASVTKTFVATLVLQLEAEGRLDIDDAVERWLPGVVPDGSAITLRELLNHTSGLFDNVDDDAYTKTLIANPGRQWSPHELLSIAFSHPPLFAPGTSWWYSNTNYVLLGLVIEAVTHSTLEQELEERIVAPLGLDATSFATDTTITGPFAHGYIGPHPGLPIPPGTLLDITSLLNPSYGWGAGNMVSNAFDVTRFYATLLQGRLLRPAELAEMKTGSAAKGDYGLGLRRAYTACGIAFGHEGDFPGYRNAVWATPNGRRVADVMVNIDPTHVSWNSLEAAAQTALCSG
jgi:D-alanyl-D-alanine carboxypeptidase